jgi:hypothetical protein
MRKTYATRDERYVRTYLIILKYSITQKESMARREWQ